MRSFKMLDKPEELEAILEPVLVREGIPIPGRGGYAAAVEFDEAGEVIAFQMLQTAIFLEGLWAKNHSAHLRSLYNIAANYAKETLGVTGMMTMTRKDKQGQRIGKIARMLGFEEMPWNIYRRVA